MRVLLALSLLAGCTPDAPAGTADDPPPVQARGPLSPDSLSGTFDGYYSAGFEHTGFRPCADTTEAWWTEPARTIAGTGPDQGQFWMTPAAEDFNTRYLEIEADSTGAYGEGVTVWTRLRGRATPRKSTDHGQGDGHLGQYARTFAVDSVEAMHLEAPPGACTPPKYVRP